jgi:transcription-repair coupling factor (superfamily II helicase)
MRAYFVSNKDQYFSSHVFGKILQYVQSHNKLCKLKDQAGKAMLVIEHVKSVNQAIEIFSHMQDLEFKSSKEISSK